MGGTSVIFLQMGKWRPVRQRFDRGHRASKGQWCALEARLRALPPRLSTELTPTQAHQCRETQEMRGGGDAKVSGTFSFCPGETAETNDISAGHNKA